nr:hypothetical protein [Tanacetum cinerariifolium]
MTTLDIPHGLHRGRNFIESFEGHSNDPMLLRMEIPQMLHLEGEEDAFVVINISGKVVKYHLILRTTIEIFVIRSNPMDDDDEDDTVKFIPHFEVDPYIYEFILSLACV